MKNWKLFTKFIEDVKAGALATIDNGKPKVRAMGFIYLGEENIIYTTTASNSRKVGQIKKNPYVSICIWKEHSFFRAEGKAEISNDLDLKKKVLEANLRRLKYYPLGAKDPKYCLIKIKVDKLETDLDEQ